MGEATKITQRQEGEHPVRKEPAIYEQKSPHQAGMTTRSEADQSLVSQDGQPLSRTQRPPETMRPFSKYERPGLWGNLAFGHSLREDSEPC